jgi:hypothetical protein
MVGHIHSLRTYITFGFLLRRFFIRVHLWVTAWWRRSLETWRWLSLEARRGRSLECLRGGIWHFEGLGTPIILSLKKEER